MAVHNGIGVPEHLDMVAAPDAGRGSLTRAVKGEDRALTDAGILLPAGSTVTFGGRGTKGPTISLVHVYGVTAAHTLPLFLRFGVARPARLSAVVASTWPALS
ncbi:hypothetical protein OG896_01945 [Streptomyces sp. NBC_00669]|uniref:hypothetical protein n=1 Tax=Streptomyces sp. NBC_00669 TaxID=2976011 RepID=UPI002E3054F1|nr:hypothetical protein [Streptomyces sp. NBC_00669]